MENYPYLYPRFEKVGGGDTGLFIPFTFSYLEHCISLVPYLIKGPNVEKNHI